jgi:uncharacterized protein with PQ loop repeat
MALRLSLAAASSTRNASLSLLLSRPLNLPHRLNFESSLWLIDGMLLPIILLLQRKGGPGIYSRRGFISAALQRENYNKPAWEDAAMQEGIHHVSKRKRAHERLEPYPHTDKWKSRVDRMVYVIALFGLAMTIPQVGSIWLEKNAAGVSAASWSAYSITAFFWLIYGILHKEKPLILINAAWLSFDIAMVAGVLIYG